MRQEGAARTHNGRHSPRPADNSPNEGERRGWHAHGPWRERHASQRPYPKKSRCGQRGQGSQTSASGRSQSTSSSQKASASRTLYMAASASPPQAAGDAIAPPPGWSNPAAPGRAAETRARRPRPGYSWQRGNGDALGGWSAGGARKRAPTNPRPGERSRDARALIGGAGKSKSEPHSPGAAATRREAPAAAATSFPHDASLSPQLQRRRYRIPHVSSVARLLKRISSIHWEMVLTHSHGQVEHSPIRLGIRGCARPLAHYDARYPCSPTVKHPRSVLSRFLLEILLVPFSEPIIHFEIARNNFFCAAA